MRQWEAWRDHRNLSGPVVPPLQDMDMRTLAHWLTRFILEVIVCGIMRHLRTTSRHEIDIFKDHEFSQFRSSLDAEMKRLQSKGVGPVHKQAEPFTTEEEELLWGNKILGDHSPEALLNTIIYMNGLYFALRSGDEHRNLRHNPCQIQVVERQGERPYLLYTEDISKNRPGGLKGRKHKPKMIAGTLWYQSVETSWLKLCPKCVKLVELRDSKRNCVRYIKQHNKKAVY